MRAILFDLDNTLYPEIEFVKSGFKSVAQYLSSRYYFKDNSLFSMMMDILERDGRGKIFDTLLNNLGIYMDEKVKLLTYIYRSHQPDIYLYEDVLSTLSKLKSRGIRLGIVTDGRASIQRNKIFALKLDNIFDVIICCDELGTEYWKPSVIPFKIGLELLNISPSDASYVGDDLSKDFIGPNTMGMLTIRMDRQTQQNNLNNTFAEIAAPQFSVKSLEEILPIIGINDDK